MKTTTELKKMVVLHPQKKLIVDQIVILKSVNNINKFYRKNTLFLLNLINFNYYILLLVSLQKKLKKKNNKNISSLFINENCEDGSFSFSILQWS